MISLPPFLWKFPQLCLKAFLINVCVVFLLPFLPRFHELHHEHSTLFIICEFFFGLPRQSRFE